MNDELVPESRCFSFHRTCEVHPMFRIAIAAAVVALLPTTTDGLRAQSKADASSKSLKLNETFEGELGEKTANIPYRFENTPAGFGFQAMSRVASIPIALKAGQQVSITASVAGEDRYVGIQLLDPDNIRFGKEKGHTTVYAKTAKLTVGQVNAKGTYTIVVFSDRSGDFTVKATSDSEEEDAKSLKEKIDRLEKELEELKAKYKALVGKAETTTPSTKNPK